MSTEPSNKVKASKNETEPIELTNDGWKIIWQRYARVETDVLNTPKKAQLERLFVTYLGIDNYATFWNLRDLNSIDKFVSVRGDIAHNGSQANYVRIDYLKKYSDLIIQTVIETDSKMSDVLKVAAANTRIPWTKDYSRDIQYYPGR